MRSDATGRSRQVVISVLGVVEILAWGWSFYLPAVLTGPVAESTGRPLSWVVGSLSLGLLGAAVASPNVEQVIQHRGGAGRCWRSPRTRRGRGFPEPLAAFMTNPAGAAIVNALGSTRQVTTEMGAAPRRHFVILSGKPGALRDPVQTQDE